MKRKIWILITLLCLALAVCAAANADGLILKDQSGAVLNDGDSVTGQIYYKFYVEGLPDGCEGIYTGWTENMSAEEPDSWEDEPRELHTDADGQYMLVVPYLIGEDLYTQEIMFARTDENSAARRIEIHYDREITTGTTTTITGGSQDPRLFEPYSLAWGPVGSADFYLIEWTMPNTYTWYLTWEDTSITMPVEGIPLDNSVGYAGEYSVQVTPFANGLRGTASAPVTFTLDVPVPAEGEQHLFLSCDRDEEDGVFPVQLHEGVRFLITADDYARYNIRDIQLINGEWADGLNIWELSNYGYTESWWTPNREKFDEYDYTAYVRARVSPDEAEEEEWIYSNALTLHVEMLSTIEEEISYTVEETSVAKDDSLIVHVNNIGADYYGCYIAGENGEWIADSRWVVAEAGETTEVRMPVFHCEPGATYEARVYAIKFGAPQKDARTTISVTVTERETDTPIIITMKDGFLTGERVRIHASYENPDGLNEETAWIQVRVCPKDDPDNIIFEENGEGFYFWTDHLWLERSGEYLVKAEIRQVDDNWEHEWGVDGTQTTFEFNVHSNGQVADPDVDAITTLTAGQDLVLNISTSSGPDRAAADSFSVELQRLEWGWNTVDQRDAEAENGAATVTFAGDSGYFEPGAYFLVRINAFKPAYDMSSCEFRFIVTAENPNQSLALTVNGDDSEEQTVHSSSNVHVKVSYQDRPTVVRILNGDQWEYWWGEDDFERDWGFGDDRLLMYAEGSWDEIDFEELDHNGWQVEVQGGTRDFDWNRDVNWTACSNMIWLNVISPYGEMIAPDAAIENEDASAAWGESLIIRIADEVPRAISAEGEEVPVPMGWFYGNLEVYRNYGLGSGWWEGVNNGYGYSLHSGLNYIPTYNLEENCRYRIEIGSDAEGYSGRSNRYEFTIGEKSAAQETIRSFTVNGQSEDLEILTCEEVQLAVYHSGAEWYDVLISREGDDGWNDSRNDCRSGMLMDNWSVDETGEYTMTAYAYGHLPEGQTNEAGYDFWEEEIGTVTVTVNALGQVAAVDVNEFTMLAAGEDLTITMSAVPAENDEETVSAEYFNVELTRIDWGWNNVDRQDTDAENGTASVTFSRDNGYFEDGGYYQVRVRAVRPGYNSSYREFRFVATDEDNLSQRLTLTLNGDDSAEQDMLSSSNIRVRVTYDTRPTAVRVLNGDQWEYWWGDDNYTRDWGFGDGTLLMFAEGTWDDIDIEELDHNGWHIEDNGEIRDFNWNRDAHWTGKSNLIRLNVYSPYGDMKTPDFAITNPQMGEGGSGVIPWGDDLVISIEDEGPADAAGNIVDGGWFFMNIQVERYDENGGSWWENLNNDGNSIHSGTNYIPTYNLDGNCRFRIEIGADARGYNGKSRWIEFRLGETPEEQNIRSFKVNGSTEHEFDAVTNEEIQLAVYRSGAEWYRVEIRRDNDEGWYNDRNDRGNGILLETWQPDREGTYQLMAIAYGHLRNEAGEIIEDEEGRDFWEDAVGRATIHVSAPNGDLGAPWVDMPMTVNAGEDMYITWHLDENVEEYSFWIGYEDGGDWCCGDSRRAGEIRRETGGDQDTYDFVIPAGSLEGNRVYRVYLDTRAAGFTEGHDDRILYVLGTPEEDQEILSITGPDEIVFGQDFPIEVSAPGAREIQIWWQTANTFRGSDGDHTVQWFCQDWDPADFQYDTENDSCHFFAIARYDDSRLKVTPHISIPFNRENVGYATAPSLTILNEGDIQRGEFIEALVGEIPDEGVTAYQVYLTDMDDNWIDFGYSETAGLFLLPTNNLETDTQYKVRAYARVPGTIRTDSEPETVTIRQATANRFIVSKTEVQVCEPLAVSILAPGAERIRFSSGYDSWWNDEGWEGDCWSSSEVRWEYSEDPDIIIRAEAWFPGDSEWTEIGTEHIRVTATGTLDRPQMDIPAIVPAGQDLFLTISEVENAEFYRINLWRNDGEGWMFDAEPGENMIPGWALYGGGYRIRAEVLAYGYNAGQTEQDLYVEPTRPEILIDSVVNNAQALDIRVPLIQNGTNYELDIHYVPADDPNDFEASYVYRKTLKDSDAVNGILTFTVPAGTLRDGMTHWVDCYVNGEDGFFCENARAFLVRNSGQADENITISVDGDTSGAVSILIHKDYRVNVSAPGANAIYIRCGDQGQYFFGDSVEAFFNEYQTYPETLYAQACYETLPEGNFEWESLNWSAPSNPVVISFYAIGQVGQPGFDMPDSVVQGDILVISNIYEGDHANETHANIYLGDPWHDAEWVYRYGWHGWDAVTRKIYLSTSMLEPGEYWVAVDNSGIGYTGNRSWRMVTVTPRGEQPEHSIFLSMPAKVQTGANLPVSVYAPGAVQTGFALDLSDAEKQDPANYMIMDGSIYYEMERYRFDEKGSHTITACARFEENGAWTLEDQTVEVCDPLRFNLADIPGMFAAGQTDAGVTIPLPENAQRMSIQVYADSDGHRETIYDSRGDLYEDTTIGIPADKLISGITIQVDFQARADGFEDCFGGISIPVTAAQGNKATLSVRTGDINDVWVNEGIEFLVSPTAGNTLTAVRFYSGNGWWDIATPETHEDWFDNGSVFFWNWYNDDPGRTITVFAEVKVAGSDAWTRTNAMQFTVKNNGTVGVYDFTDTSGITAARGTVIEVTFEPAEGADSYWADAFSTWDNCSRNPETRNDAGTTTVRINTINLVPGTYELWGRAGGPRLQWRQSSSCVMLTITDNVPDMPAATFRTPGALTTIEEEAFEGIPAEVAEIGENVGNIYYNAFAGSGVKTVIIRNGGTWIDDSAFAGCGVITVYSVPNSEVQWWAERNGYSFYPIP